MASTASPKTRAIPNKNKCHTTKLWLAGGVGGVGVGEGEYTREDIDVNMVCQMFVLIGGAFISDYVWYKVLPIIPLYQYQDANKKEEYLGKYVFGGICGGGDPSEKRVFCKVLAMWSTDASGYVF